MANLKASKIAQNNTQNNNILVKNNNHFPNKIFNNININKFMIHHQNIRGISSKVDELLITLSHNTPQIICLTEHHLKAEEINNINVDQYNFGASFCRQIYKYGGVCIYVSPT